jgi:hypothetical protein
MTLSQVLKNEVSKLKENSGLVSLQEEKLDGKEQGKEIFEESHQINQTFSR